MTEENKIQIVGTKECFCQSKGFRKFLIIALGSFVGVFCALSLFAALHKPPMPPCHYAKMMRPSVHSMHRIDRFDRYHKFNRASKVDFQKKFEKREFDRVPIEKNN